LYRFFLAISINDFTRRPVSVGSQTNNAASFNKHKRLLIYLKNCPGDVLTAQEAVASGLVSKILSRNTMLVETIKTAKQLASLPKVSMHCTVFICPTLRAVS
jgi:hypothetical protein